MKTKKKKIFRRLLVGLMLLVSVLVLTGCEQEKPKDANNYLQSVSRAVLKKPTPIPKVKIAQKPAGMSGKQGKTIFAFAAQNPLQLTPGAEATVTALFTPVYDPVSTLQIPVRFDPKVITVTELIPAKDIIPFRTKIDAKTGQVEFVAGMKPQLFGVEIPAFDLKIRVNQTAPAGETVIEFIGKDLSALLPDVNNTETAITEALPRQVLSIKTQ